MRSNGVFFFPSFLFLRLLALALWKTDGSLPFSNLKGKKNVDNRCTDRGIDPNSGEEFVYTEVASRCRGRIDIKYKFDQELFAKLGNETGGWLDVVKEVLGSDCRMQYAGQCVGYTAFAYDHICLHDPCLLRLASSTSLLPARPSISMLTWGYCYGMVRCGAVGAGLVLSLPGSDDQGWHTDGEHLFPGLDHHTPPYAVTVFVPLVDLTAANGTPEFFLGSQLCCVYIPTPHACLQRLLQQSGAP